MKNPPTNPEEPNKNIRHAANIMTRDLLSAEEITACSPNASINFTRKTMDISGGITNLVTTVNRFYLNGSELMREQNGQARRLADGISAMSITLYDKHGGITVDPASVYSVNIELTAASTVVRKNYEDSVQTRVRLRNK